MAGDDARAGQLAAPIFNFDEIAQVVGSRYEYGLPCARHAIFGAPATEPAGAAE